MADTPSEATAAAACYACIPNDMRMPVLIYLYNKLSGMNATPQELVTAAACYACIPANLQMPVLISMVAAGGIGGASTGTGSPEGVLEGNVGAFYWDSAANTLYFKATGTGDTGWIVLLGV